MSTAGNPIEPVPVLPAASRTVTAALAALALAVPGVPEITPVAAAMLNPEGRPVALNASMPATLDGVIAAIAWPTLSVVGAVQAGAAGATRSTVSRRSTSAGEVYPDFDADTVTSTLVPAMYAAPAGTLTDQTAGSAAEEVAVRVAEPIRTLTLTPLSEPVSPAIAKPAAFSAMLTASSVAMAFTWSTRLPTASTVTV